MVVVVVIGQEVEEFQSLLRRHGLSWRYIAAAQTNGRVHIKMYLDINDPWPGSISAAPSQGILYFFGAFFLSLSVSVLSLFMADCGRSMVEKRVNDICHTAWATKTKTKKT